ncbi:UNVERIFIED_CONTAM: putative nucleotidyltransferase [Brevibacillus sp. OAP136]
MGLFGWNTCPVEQRRQIHRLMEALLKWMPEKPLGVYLHGSLARGCFSPKKSDLDLLVISAAHLPHMVKERLTDELLALSNHPSPIEIHIIAYDDIWSGSYPMTFELHYSEWWRDRLKDGLPNGTDPDLAAHLMITKHRGVCLYGAPIDAIIPDVPRTAYLQAIFADLAGVQEWVMEKPVYAVLNMCRVWQYVAEGTISSKLEGGMWVLRYVTDAERKIVAQAVEAYQQGAPGAFEEESVRQLVREIGQKINSCKKHEKTLASLDDFML